MKTLFMHDQRGSSSVLVILTMLMLVLFGVLGMVSAYSDYRIAQKNANWTQDYYIFEAKAQEQVSAIDALVIGEKAAAMRIYKQWQFNQRLTEELDDVLRNEVVDFLQNSRKDKQHTENRLFMILMKYKLPGFDSDTLIESQTNSIETVLLWTKTIELESKRRYMVQLDLSPDQNKRYTITIWREIPETFDYSKGMEFEDVEVIGS